jgi:transcription initiation factor TFIIE subunit alpha
MHMATIKKINNKDVKKESGLKTKGKSTLEDSKKSLHAIKKSEKKTINSSKVIEVISNLIGEDVIDLVIELITQDEYSEFKLAEKLNQDVNVTRNMLYRLLEHNFVFFSRRKDKRKGWYIYYWTFNPNDIEKKRIHILEKQLSELQSRLSNDFNHDIFFICNNKCEKYDFDFAAEHEFKCQECGELLQQFDNSRHKQDIVEKMDSLKLEMIELRN